MSAAPQFSASAHQNEYLPDGGTRVDAVIRVDATVAGAPGPQPGLDGEFVILLDCSGSMSDPPTKLSEARRAAVAALAALRDGVAFAVIAGNTDARVVYPSTPCLVTASEETRAAATIAVSRLRAGGGTAIGRWLTLANSLFSTRGRVVRHAILLTDGKNQHETQEELDAALASCRNRFRCDCRAAGAGGGTHGWSGAELLRIAQALSGTVQNVEVLADLPANLSQATAVAMGHTVADLRLRVRVAQGTAVRFLKQVHPSINDLTVRAHEVQPHTYDYSTGAWGIERRDYHLALTVAPRPAGTSLRVAWVSLLTDTDAQATGGGLELAVAARWTHDPRESTRINPQVAHYSGLAELAAAIQDGVEAYQQERLGIAQELLGRAVALAHRAQQSDQLTNLARIVDIDDAARGLVRLRTDIDPTGVESAVLDSVRTGGFRAGAGAQPRPAQIGFTPGERCPVCQAPRVDRYCEQDGHDFAGAGGSGASGGGAGGSGSGDGPAADG